MQRFLRALVAMSCVFAALAATAARAQFPSRAVTLVVPSAPGGETDTSARLIATKLTERWGRAVLIENKPGNGGIVGAEFVAKAEPDGHVLLMGTVGTQAINPALHRKLAYDPDKAFAPVSLVAEVPLVLLVHPSIKAQAPRDLVALAKPKSAPLKYASAGNGSLMHLAAVLFESLARVPLVHVPHKSDVQAISDLVEGRVQLAFAPLPEVIGHITSGKLRPLAVTSAQRSPALPKLQTVAESGIHGYESAAWVGILVPAGTPAATIDQIAKDVHRAVTSSDVRHKLDQEGAIAVGGTPAQFKSVIERDRQRYARLIQEKGVTLD
ncbi:MAG TPA: tripartite tricarboxylate transporter substrate binding protein [Burkholderiales bacterium]|nr:tripartite tricarboxylate transporter substrate binding protein [Burkholderiales bacterium]